MSKAQEDKHMEIKLHLVSHVPYVPCIFPVGVAVSLDDEIFQAKQRALQPKDAAGPGFGSWVPQIQNHFIPLW